ncbi:MAG: outer membrane lipoprotein carrier protein LolA [Bacteroidaceae bacterium]|nr:outer membrane lipoprotein carrier protein LolA [Bacteroidaceae bacterium]
MKNIYLLLLLSFLSLCAKAQVLDADAMLDKAVEVMKADAPLQMDYSYTVYDDDGEVVVDDKGVMRLDGNRYSLVMDKMGIWCNGETQWSYMLEIDEIYITDSSSDEAQNLSPLFIMENYRNGCVKEVAMRDGMAVITLQAAEENGFEKVVLRIGAEDNRLKAMEIFMPGQGQVAIVLDKYQIKCNFAQEVYECPVEEFKTAEIVDMR